MELTVALLEVEHPGNLGAVARAMKNFAVDNLLLVDPKCDPNDEEAKNRAKWGNDVLESATTGTWKDLEGYDLVVATTGKTADDFNLPRSPLTPRQLAEKLAGVGGGSKVALLFGRESDGLRNDELKKCDFTVAIPTSTEYASMNLSHAVAVLLYELTHAMLGDELLEKYPLVKAATKNALLEAIDDTLEKLPFTTSEKQVTQEVLWKRLVGKSMLTQREAMALMGFFRKLR